MNISEDQIKEIRDLIEKKPENPRKNIPLPLSNFENIYSFAP